MEKAFLFGGLFKANAIAIIFALAFLLLNLLVRLEKNPLKKIADFFCRWYFFWKRRNKAIQLLPPRDPFWRKFFF